MRRASGSSRLAAAVAVSLVLGAAHPGLADTRDRDTAQYEDMDDDAPGRVVLEMLGGLVFGTMGGIVGWLGGPPGVLGGIVFAEPLGVYLAGNLLDGNGSYWLSMLGGVGGWVAAIAAMAAAEGTEMGGGNGVVVAVVVLGLPLSGSMLGYEWSNSPEAGPGTP